LTQIGSVLQVAPSELIHRAGSRRPKSPNWVIRGTIRGICVEESTRTSDKQTAEEIRAKREVELLAQSVYGRRATATFAEAALNYMEQGAVAVASLSQ
jgi:hypothetical protein